MDEDTKRSRENKEITMAHIVLLSTIETELIIIL